MAAGGIALKGEEMKTETLLLIIELCKSSIPGTIDRCVERSKECVKYYKKESAKRVESCVSEAKNDGAADWATNAGYRQLQLPPFESCKWSKKFWGVKKCPTMKEFQEAAKKANPEIFNK
jgi:hypothetical protein